MIHLTHDPIDTSPLLTAATCDEAGAVVLFLGITRRYTDGRETLRLSYEAYEEMARCDLERLAEVATQKWELTHCSLTHRLGEVPVGEASVAIVISSPHRADAFAAGQWLIDSLKESTPIWKQEQFGDGTQQWVHPVAAVTNTSSTPRVPTPSGCSPAPDNSGPPPAGLIDRFGRVHRSLRISVTDRCNIRCFYCMPEGSIQFRRREELLTFEEIETLVAALLPLGIDKLRLTGGEPLVRSELPRLVERLAALPGVRDLALTTNGILLPEQAVPLRRAGLKRLNISLDSLREEVFQEITRRSGVDRVLAGIQAAHEAGFESIRLNAVAIRDLTEDDIVPLVTLARDRGMQMRFIEFMPLDSDHRWARQKVLTGAQIKQQIERALGPLVPAPRHDPSQPAVDFVFADGAGSVGFINPVSEPFCGACDRLRVTAEGQLRNCLFSSTEWDAREILRRGGTAAELRQLVRDCVAAKAAAHGIGEAGFVPPQRAMYQIGG